MAKAQRMPSPFELAKREVKAGKIVVVSHPICGKGVVREMFRSRGEDLIVTLAGTVTAAEATFATFSDSVEAQRFLNNQ